MNKSRLLCAVCACLFSLISMSANAAVVTYNESTDGDLIHGVPLNQITNVGTFDIGINTVSGNISTIVPGTTVYDADDFIFSIPNGLQLSSVSFSFSNIAGLTQITPKIREVIDISNMIIGMQDSEFINFSTGGLPINTSPVSAFESFLPASAGIYDVLTPASAGLLDGVDVNMDYVWQFEVTAIPIPPALWLFGSGLLGLVGVARRNSE